MFEELTEKIKGLDGIVSCKITGEDRIDEVHILAGKERDPKRIVRDIETMVMVNLGVEIDHKKISIARINKSVEEMDRNRVEIISIYKENNRSVIHFKLKVNGEMIEEEKTDGLDEPLPIMVAKGMSSIIEKYTSFDSRIRVENVFTTGINNEIVIAQIITHDNNNQERLLGAAYINHDLALATGKAFLKALNRKIGS